MERKNVFQKIYDECNDMTPEEKINNIPKFPRCIDVELTNKCNYKCLMCPVGTGMMKRSKGFMSNETFEKFIEEIKEYKTPIRFIGWGEPTMNFNIIEYIKIAKKNGIITHLNTNGLLLDENYIIDLINSGLDSIKFSFQGVDAKSYKEMRNKDMFDELLKKIKLIYDIRGDRRYPYIHISTTITYENNKLVQDFINRVKNNCDLVTVGRTILEHINMSDVILSDNEKERIINLKNNETLKKERFECCPEVFDKVSIHWNGDISACCNDYDGSMIIGNLSINTIKGSWNSEKMKMYRDILKKKEYEKIEICKYCYNYIVNSENTIL